MLFQSNSEVGAIEDEARCNDLIFNVEIPVSLNLGLCHLKLGDYPLGIHFLDKVVSHFDNKRVTVEKLNNGKSILEKTYYRRGMCHLKSGTIYKAKADLM